MVLLVSGDRKSNKIAIDKHTKGMLIYIQLVCGGKTMARNKYPEQTIERILEVSTKLFFEKGYENTSVQDILDELGDLSKGAIYHHFKSKEDIFNVIATKIGESNLPFFNQIQENTSLTGAEKLQKLLSLSIASDATKQIIDISPSLLDNPKFLAIQMKHIRDFVAPNFITPMIEEGIKDGSIKAENAYELGEVITLLVNVWINPLILGSDIKRLPAKCKIINEFLAQYHIILFDEETIANLSKF